MLNKQFNYDFNRIKEYGPRSNQLTIDPNAVVDPTLGVDASFSDATFLLYWNAKNYDMQKTVMSIHHHMKYRQNFIPRPMLTDKVANLVNSGLYYIHGRSKFHSPIVVFNCAVLRDLWRAGQLDFEGFCGLQHYINRYMLQNMIVPGQVEKWLVISDIAHYTVKEVPLALMKQSITEISSSYVETLNLSCMINLTWMQQMFLKFLISLVDETTQRRYIFPDSNADALLKYVHPSQLEEKYGGTAPNATRFFPPTMPEMVEQQEDMSFNENLQVIAKEDYDDFLKTHPGYVAMPEHLKKKANELSPLLIESMETQNCHESPVLLDRAPNATKDEDFEHYLDECLELKKVENKSKTLFPIVIEHYTTKVITMSMIKQKSQRHLALAK